MSGIEGASKKAPAKWISRFWSFMGAVSIQTKILGIALSLVFLLGAVAILVVRASVSRVLTREIESGALSISENLAMRVIDPILVDNRYLLYQLISETKANYPDLRYIFVVDSRGRVLAHTFGPGFPLALLTANGVPPGGSAQVLKLETTEGPIWDIAAPIFEGRVGTIRLGFSDALLVRSTKIITTQLLLATLVVSSVGILFAMLLTFILTRPIKELAQAASAVGKGDLNQHVTRWADDEIGELADSFNAMVENLRLAAKANEEREHLRTEIVERVISAQEEERKRIACDLHDQTSQALVSLIVQLKLVETSPNSRARQQNIEILRQQLRDALGEVRRMAVDLRPNVLDDLGLVQAIHWFASRCSQNDGLEVYVTSTGELDHLPERYRVTIYRVIQEALSNIVKHSQARRALVDIKLLSDGITLHISDDGIGLIKNPGSANGMGLGMLGMRERIALLGGDLAIHSQPGQGVLIKAEIPLELIPEG